MEGVGDTLRRLDSWGNSVEVATLLKSWDGGVDRFSNGVVVELMNRFSSPEVVTAASKLSAQLLNMNLQRLTTDLVHNK